MIKLFDDIISFVARCLWVSIACFFSIALHAEVTVDAKLDSVRMVVGEQSVLTLTVNCSHTQKVQLPVFNKGDEIVSGLEIVKCIATDTTFDDSRNTQRVSAKYVVTAFDTASYVLPPFSVKVDNNDYTTKRLKLSITEFPVDTTNVNKYYPIKDIQQPAFLWQDWKWIVFNALVAAFLLLMSGIFYTWLCNGVPVIRLLRRKPKLPPHQVAMHEINQLKYNKKLAEEDSKAYYTQLTETLRTYIRDRYGFNALEMTSTEIISRLQEENDNEALEELKELFQTADLAKFAKYNALVGENDAHLLTAIDYVNRTKLEVDPNAKDEQPKLSKDDKRHIAMKWVLRILISVFLSVVILLLVFDVYRVMLLVG